jgi:hypothetical protein
MQFMLTFGEIKFELAKAERDAASRLALRQNNRGKHVA